MRGPSHRVRRIVGRDDCTHNVRLEARTAARIRSEKGERERQRQWGARTGSGDGSDLGVASWVDPGCRGWVVEVGRDGECGSNRNKMPRGGSNQHVNPSTE